MKRAYSGGPPGIEVGFRIGAMQPVVKLDREPVSTLECAGWPSPAEHGS